MLSSITQVNGRTTMILNSDFKFCLVTLFLLESAFIYTFQCLFLTRQYIMLSYSSKALATRLYSFVTRLYSSVIRLLFVCCSSVTRLYSSVTRLYSSVFVCYSSVTCLLHVCYLSVTRLLLLCIRLLLVCHWGVVLVMIVRTQLVDGLCAVDLLQVVVLAITDMSR